MLSLSETVQPSKPRNSVTAASKAAPPAMTSARLGSMPGRALMSSISSENSRSAQAFRAGRLRKCPCTRLGS